MEKAAPLKRVDKQTNSKSEKSQKPLRDGAAAVARRSGGAVARRVYYLVFLLFFCLLLRGENMANGGREKAPVQNTG